jgi:phage shock protein B
MEHAGVLIPIMALSIPLVAILSRRAVTVMELRHEERMARGTVSADDAAQWSRTVERLAARMKVLESILDDEVPGWRRKVDD